MFGEKKSGSSLIVFELDAFKWYFAKKSTFRNLSCESGSSSSGHLYLKSLIFRSGMLKKIWARSERKNWFYPETDKSEIQRDFGGNYLNFAPKLKISIYSKIVKNEQL